MRLEPITLSGRHVVLEPLSMSCAEELVAAANADRSSFGFTAVPAEAEIGGTWLRGDAQRSAINTEAKLLLLAHAFDQWQVHRVAICTDARNTRSRTAIERLGATFEGVLRNHRPAAGDAVPVGGARDTAVHSIISSEWPAVRERLAERLHRV